MSYYTIQQLETVQYNINHINKITYEAQDELEEKKNDLLEELNSIRVEEEEELSNELNKKQMLILKSIEDVEQNIQTVQNEHDGIINELEKRKQGIKKRLSALGKLDALITCLTYKIFDTQQEFYEKVETLLKEERRVRQTFQFPTSKVTRMLANIQREINDLKNVHDEMMLNLEGQRNELRKEFAIKTQQKESAIQSLNIQYHFILDDLQQSKMNANKWELKEVDRRMAELERLHQNDVVLLNELDLKEGNDTEHLEAILDVKNYKITNSSASESTLTSSNASHLRLLKDINMSSWSQCLQSVPKQSDSQTSFTSSSSSESSGTESKDVHYLKTLLGKPLILALKEVSMKKPRDPIYYLAHWLLRYRYNEEISIIKKKEIENMINERERLEKEKLHAMFEYEAHAAVLSAIARAEEEALQNELERIARNAMEVEGEDDKGQ